MATLVLSTVGTVLGGPVGAAIGALIGQSIDQQLLGPASRGPRLGDLGVQTSSYGTQIPRIYGTMRVAGSVIWSTDLVESTETTGAKGQPDTTFSYSVSFAVALSARRVAQIGRIWADGKLLRGAEGDFKVSTTFRFHDGSEDQLVDPLIGSIEGSGTTPAYRGVALALFENLELAEFGNRIPFLTFEVIADEAAPTLAAILADASEGLITSEASQSVTGYAAHGPSMKAAAEPLLRTFGVNLFDDGSYLRGPLSQTVEAIVDDDLGNSADGQQAPRMRREQLPARAVPARLRLSYYDPERDYQAGEAGASASDDPGSEQQQELPAAIGADDAKALVQQMLARAWAQRDKLTLRLPPRLVRLEPGSTVEVGLSPKRWIVDKCTVDGLVVVAELRSAWMSAPPIAADAGRIVANSDVVAGQAEVALFDVPDVLHQSSTEPTLLLAASSSTPGWRACAIDVGYSGQAITIRSARLKSVLGHALSSVGAGQPYLVDAVNSVDIELLDQDQWLVSSDDEALAAGANLAALGSELIQFGRATPLGSGRFRLARLLRGRGGTEWATTTHGVGEPFVLIERDALQPVTVPLSATGSQVTAVPRGGDQTMLAMTTESLRPPSPVRLTAEPLPGGGLKISWTRRSRRGFAWIDEVDAPLAEAREEYRVTIAGSSGAIELTVGQPELTLSAGDLGTIGSGSATVQVRQVGDWAMSRPARLSLILS